MNYWHDIEAGTKDKINVIIEIPKYSRNKYEIDKKTGLITLDRSLCTSQDFPCNYGFIPRTLWYDDDAVDVCVLSTNPIHPGILVRVRPVGVFRVIDSGESDDKIIAVDCGDPRFNEVLDIEDVNSHTIKEISHFFETYKVLKGKEVKIKGVENKAQGQSVFEEGVKLYKDSIKGV